MRSWHVDGAAHADYASVEFWDNALLANAHDALAMARRLVEGTEFDHLPQDARALTHMTVSRASFTLGAQDDARQAAEQALALCDEHTSAPVRFDISLGASAVLAESGAVDVAFGILERLEPYAH